MAGRILKELEEVLEVLDTAMGEEDLEFVLEVLERIKKELKDELA